MNKLMRLIEFDDSKEFRFIVNIKEEQENYKYDNIEVSEETNITIKTSMNKARVISRNIDELYKTDQTIDHYEIKLNNIQENNKTQKVVEVFNILLNSIGQEINVREELGVIFLMIEYELGEDIDAHNNNNNKDNHDNTNINNVNKNMNNNNNNKDDNDELGYSDLLFMYKIYK